jgi:hypothetical protein
MEATLAFEVAVYSAWIASAGALLLLVKYAPARWHATQPVSFKRPGREFFWALAAAIVLFAISFASDNLLAPWKRQPVLGDVVYLGQLLLVYSPIFLVLWWRRQGLRSCFLRLEKWPTKIGAGLLLGTLGAGMFLLSRGRIEAFPELMSTLGHGGPVAMVQTFMEGFGIGFLLYRAGAWLGVRWSSVIVSVLFMAAHIPNYVSGASTFPLATALALAAAHAGIGVLILVVIWRSQDIIVLGFLHWFINRAAAFTVA